jgi:hypothetical protein
MVSTCQVKAWLVVSLPGGGKVLVLTLLREEKSFLHEVKIKIKERRRVNINNGKKLFLFLIIVI